MTLSRASRIQGGLYGLLIGDALGVPYEFHPAFDIPGADEIEFTPPPEFRRAHQSVRPGTWSDDGAQALCLLASLLHNGSLDLRDFSNRLVNWLEYGYMAVDGRVFDVGAQTADALRRLKAGADPRDSGGAAEHSQGNGSLMRVLPLVLWHQEDDQALVRDAHLQSLPTHGHPTVQVCCALYCLWARRLLEGSEAAWDEAVGSLRRIYADDLKRLEVLEAAICPDQDREPGGSGFVIDSLFSAKAVMREASYERVVKAAVLLGNDTDTTACIAGGLAGLRFGMEGLPSRWLDALRGKDEVEPLLARLLGSPLTEERSI